MLIIRAARSLNAKEDASQEDCAGMLFIRLIILLPLTLRAIAAQIRTIFKNGELHNHFGRDGNEIVVMRGCHFACFLLTPCVWLSSPRLYLFTPELLNANY